MMELHTTPELHPKSGVRDINQINDWKSIEELNKGQSMLYRERGGLRLTEGESLDNLLS